MFKYFFPFQTDVSGICAAEYRVLRRTFNSIVMSKNKDLMSCTDRHGHVSSLQATPYRVDSVSRHKASSNYIDGPFQCLGNFPPKHKDAKIFEKHLNLVSLVFTG